MEAHSRNCTQNIILQPKGYKVIGSCWVFKMKHNTDGFVEYYKACLIAKGFSQCPRFDYFETFAPTAKFVAICAILALFAFEDLYLCFVDIFYVFISGDLDNIVYMAKTGKLFVVKEAKGSSRVHRL